MFGRLSVCTYGVRSCSLAGLSAFPLPARLPTPPFRLQLRRRGDLAPKRTKYRKAQKGNVPVRTGGSLNGTTLEHGDFGLRVKEPTRLSAKVLKSCETAVKRSIKSVKGAQFFMRVFPSIPVCIKGNETRMGKGKGTFEYWACRAPVGRMIFEVGGGGIQKEVAFAALRLAQVRLPVTSELVDRNSNVARLGNQLLARPGHQSHVEASKGGDDLEAMMDQIKALEIGKPSTVPMPVQ